MRQLFSMWYLYVKMCLFNVWLCTSFFFNYYYYVMCTDNKQFWMVQK